MLEHCTAKNGMLLYDSISTIWSLLKVHVKKKKRKKTNADTFILEVINIFYHCSISRALTK